MNGNFAIKQYEDNEFQLGAARYVILLGNSDENSLAKDYLPLITFSALCSSMLWIQLQLVY
jgi:hypothetical protein